MMIRTESDPSPVEVTEEAIKLIRTWVKLAAETEPGILRHEMDIASVLISAAARTNPGAAIGAAEVYEGWSRQISERVTTTIGLCPPHECLFRSIVIDQDRLVGHIVDSAVDRSIRDRWDDIAGVMKD